MNTTTITNCRACNEPMETFSQERPGGKPRMTCATCVNTDCAMHGYTFSLEGYSEIDLAKYGATEYEAVEDDEPELCGNCGNCADVGRHFIHVAVDHWICQSEPRYLRD